MTRHQFLMGLWFSALVSFASPVVAEGTPQTLEQAWIQAYQENPALESERAKLRATDEEVSQALSHWRPTVDLTTNVGKTYQDIPDQQIYGTADFQGTTRGGGVQVTQPLFRGFRTEAETESAEKKVLAGRAQLESAEQKLLMDTGKAFLDTARDQMLLQIDGDNENVLSKKLEETRVRSDAGELTRTDVQQAESRLARAQVSRVQTQNNLTADRDAYTRLVGDIPGALIMPDLTLDDLKAFDDAMRLAGSRNPDVVAAQFAVDEAHAEIALARDALLPEIDLVGNASRNWDQGSTVPGREDNYQVLLQATIPLYRAGSDYSKTRAAGQVETQRRMELETARRAAFEGCHNAWASLTAAQASITADQNEIDAATHALEGVTIEAHVGTRTTLDVLNAQQELLDAKTEMARAVHDRNLAILQIKVAIGKLTANGLKLAVDHYDPRRHYEDVRNKWIGFGKDNDTYSMAPASDAKP